MPRLNAAEKEYIRKSSQYVADGIMSEAALAIDCGSLAGRRIMGQPKLIEQPRYAWAQHLEAVTRRFCRRFCRDTCHG